MIRKNVSKMLKLCIKLASKNLNFYIYHISELLKQLILILCSEYMYTFRVISKELILYILSE